MTLDWFFTSDFYRSRLSPLDTMLGLIAGAVHDVGHPGRTNAFQSKTMSPLAIRYNDRSILENMHASLCFEIAQEPTCNWIKQLNSEFQFEKDPDKHSADLQRYARKCIV